MNYILILMGGREYEINEQEHRAVIGSVGMINLSRLGVTINCSSISAIEPKGTMKPVDRTKQLEAITPEGEHVIKRFGQWYIANPASPYQYNEKGESILRYDGHPLLPTPEEYEEQFKQLPASQWPQLLTGQSSDLDDRLLVDRSNRVTGGGFERIESSFAPNLTRDDVDV